MKAVIIQGSSRKDGETRKVVDELKKDTNWDFIDLNDFEISYYDYEHANRGDDFIDLMKRIIENYDVLIFATPVYWYSMSGIMKVFFDRITDLITIEKESGRKLRGKSMAVLSSSNGNNLGDHFWLPFKNSAEYLGMHYISDLHTYQDRFEPENIADFKQKILSASS